MEHNWPHYEIGPEGGKREICTCVHMEAIIEYFKNKNDLTMVLGVGDTEHDYTTRFKYYNFVLGIGDGDEQHSLMAGKLLKAATVDLAVEELKNKLKNRQSEPLLIWLNFNDYMFEFLDRLPGKFKEIIFDTSVTKFVGGNSYQQHSWGLWQINKIFNALGDGGEFYLDTSFFGGYSVIFVATDGSFKAQGIDLDEVKRIVSIANNQVSYNPEYGDISDYKKYADYLILQLMKDPNFDCGDISKIKSHNQKLTANVIKLLKSTEKNKKDKLNTVSTYFDNTTFCIRPCYGLSLVLQGGKDFTAGKYVTKKDSETDGMFMLPNNEFMAEHIVAFLKLAGFEAEYRQNSPYPSPPSSTPWETYPGKPEITFTSYNYIYAKKPVNLSTKLTSLKDSLTQLKNKLGNLQEKLKTLKQKLG
jgi:hypothetical protein